MATKTQAINFDFGTHWKTRIVPVIRRPEVVESIRTALDDYLPLYGWEGKKKWDETKPPLIYSRDEDCDLYIRTDEHLIETWRPTLLSRTRSKEDLKLGLAFLRAETKLKASQKEDEFGDGDDDLFQAYIGAQQDLIAYRERTERPWQDQLENYIMHLASHWWAPHFELTLAKLVEPSESWHVLSGPKYSTVINADGTKCFDLLAWAHEQLEHYLFGDEVNPPDASLGGTDAVRRARERPAKIQPRGRGRGRRSRRPD